MKNSCKKMFSLSAVLALAGMPVAALASPVTLYQNYGGVDYSYSVGGEFTAVTDLTQSQLQGLGYASSTLVGDNKGNYGFQTFCVETLVDFSPGNSYSYNIGSATGANAVQGGINLTEGAAYLYYQFATGGLAGYNYGSTATRIADAGELQAAIWYFMGEGGSMPGGFTTAGDPFITAAQTYLAGLGLNATNANTTFDVGIMQLTDGNNAAQNQLILTTSPNPNGHPVPDGALTVGLLGISLGGMFLIQARRRKSTANSI